MRDFLSELDRRKLVFDGATGTMLQRLGLKPGGCPDELCLREPGLVKKVHSYYVEAGSDIITTNTFGANRAKLKEYSLEAALRDINVAAARCAREAAGEGRFVAGCLGPTGRFVEPVGDMPFEEALSIFSEQARALKEGGADLIIIETMMDIKEMKAAIMGAKSTGLPVVATMTFDETMRTVLGTPPESFAIMAATLGADCIGANCSLGIEGIYKAVLAMSKVVSVPLIAQPNAGIPVLKGTETIFPASPDEMAAFVPKLVEAGVRVLGGCCGTTPEHIKMMAGVFRKLPPAEKRSTGFTALSSRSSFTLFGAGLPPIVIGERINPTGRKAFAAEIKEGKTAGIRNEARTQEAAGAHALDVNVGVPGTDEAASMRRAIFAVNENSTLPAVIDSSSPEAVLAGLRAIDGRPLVNSISGEEKKLESILPIVREYGAAVLGLALDDDGVPETAEGRFRAAEKMLERVLKAGMRKEDLVIDCLAMTVSAAPLSAMETLKAIRMVKERLGLSTVLGVSNISFGLPAREVINGTFLTMAIESGLDAAIIDSNNKAMMDAYQASLVLLNKDLRAERYIKRHQAMEAAQNKTGQESSKTFAPTVLVETTGERLKRAIIEGDEENIVIWVEKALNDGWDPLKISNEALVPGLEEVGRLFASNMYYLPQVMLSADTMKKAFERLKKEMQGRKGPALGKVLLATVEGDIHDIGKNIVATLLENHGFDVIDLGKNVPADRIVEEAEKNKVDIVGLSALMTTTVLEMDTIIKKLKDKGIKALTIVGGAVVTQEFSDKIGADQYGGDALSAVEKMKKLIGQVSA
ncbi:MAG: homocysteine S-methyltransferase family protein [Deltaproteobacteria bacterium]|nr:homocysteine S-methyltransferase family protein [Deltaproteobacteria bacterium]